MPLTAGSRLGQYQIIAPLGAGGMGEVYRGRDTRLDREVAIKVLPAAVAQDTERLARFEREAKVLASLNHPNIAQIYGVEDNGETRGLVMELVTGATLTVPQPLETALNYARQIAEALEVAHDKGITHRDLKPANIMVTSDGVVKVLDFGLASIPGQETYGNSASSPTMTMRATQAGMIMGTAGYMSPEQAAGKAVDKRSDIWSFGVVLWEMLAGTRLFDGETISHTLADVLRAPLDFGKLPPNTPAPVVQLVKRCLDRNVKTRLQAIGEARIAIEKYSEDPNDSIAPPREGHPSRSASLPWAVAAALGLAVAVLSFVVYVHRQELAPRLLTALVLPPEHTTFVETTAPAVSPDGRKLAFAAVRGSTTSLWIRDLDSLTSRSLTGTEGATAPFWSPDSRSLGFFADSKVKRIDLDGGAVRTLCPMGGMAFSGSWSSRGVILFTNSPNTGLYQVAATGGGSLPVTTFDANSGEIAHRLPWFLPDGQHYLFSIRRQDASLSGVYVGDLDGKQRTQVIQGEAHAAYVRSGGFLVFTAVNTQETPLMAQPFDTTTFRTSGERVPIAASVMASWARWAQHQFSVSDDGVLAYSSSSNEANRSRLTWLDRSGKVLGIVPGPEAGVRAPAISPDGRLVAAESTQTGNRDIWIHDLARGSATRLTFNPAGIASMEPVWSPDGRYVLFAQRDQSQSASSVIRKAVGNGGLAETISARWGQPPGPVIGLAVSPDGLHVVARVGAGITNGGDLWMMSLKPPGDAPRPYLNGHANENQPVISPSGKWLAYASDETGQYGVYIESFPKPGRKYQVALDSGAFPVWSRDGKELYYIGLSREIIAVPVKEIGDGLEIGPATTLFDSKLAALSAGFDVSPEGRFLITTPALDTAAPLTLVVNWQAGLKK